MMRRYELSQREFYFKEKEEPLDKAIKWFAKLEVELERRRILEEEVEEGMQYCKQEGIQYQNKDIKNMVQLFHLYSNSGIKRLRPILICLVEILNLNIQKIETTSTCVKLITSKGTIILASISIDSSIKDVDYECYMKLQKDDRKKTVVFYVKDGNVYDCEVVFSQTRVNSWNILVDRYIPPKKVCSSNRYHITVTYNFVCPSWKQEKKVNAYLTSLSAKQLLQVSTVRKIIQMSQCTKQEITFQVERQDHTLPFPLLYYQRKEGKETVYRTRKITILPKEIVRLGSSHAGIYYILTTKGNYYWIEEALFAERRKLVVLNKTLLDALVYEGDRNSIKQIGQVL